MAYQPAALNNLREGLRQDVESFLLDSDGSPSLLNINYFRGRLVENGGEQLLAEDNTEAYKGRLGARLFAGTTDGSGNIPNATVFYSSAISPGTIVITQGALTAIDNGQGTFVDYKSSGWAGTGTVNYASATTTSAITGWATTTAYSVYFLRQVDQYSPVMGLRTRELTVVNKQELWGFDLLKPYRFSVALDCFFLNDAYESTAADNPVLTFQGTDLNFFWTCNLLDAFWVTNDVYGFQAKQDVTAVTTGATTTITFAANHTFLVNDTVFLWDIGGVTLTTTSGLVTAVPASNQITVAVASTGTFTTGGTVQSITRQLANQGDGIKWFDGAGWHNFFPPVTGSASTPGNGGTADYLMGCLIMIPYKGFLLTLNTWEGSTYANAHNYQQRARWSQNGTPFYSSPTPTVQGVDGAAWIQSTGRGGYIDAPTQEQIVSCAFIRDTLVVYFERSTWLLDFTEDLFLPFVWRQVNSQYGSQSTFGTISYDRGTFTFSEDGIIASDGANNLRIDQKIPDFIYDISKTADEQQRVQGQLNFVGQNIKWCYADQNIAPITYPNREIIYNLLDQSWAINEGFHTSYCRWEKFYNLTWADANFSWASANFAWNSVDDNDGDTITVGGNSQGFIHVLPTEQITQQSYNDRQFSVTSVDGSGYAIVPNHSFNSGQFVYLTGMGGSNAAYNNTVYKLQVISSTQLQLINSAGAAVTMSTQAISSGFMALVSNLSFMSKRFYPAMNEGLESRLGYIDFFFNPSATNQVLAIDLFIDEFTTPVTSPLGVGMPTALINLQGIQGSSQSKIMKRVYFQSQGTSFSFRLYYPDSEMFAYDTGDKQFVLHQFTPWYKSMGRMVRQPTI